MGILRIMMIGDVMGESGLAVLEAKLPLLIKEHAVNFTVVNGENSAGGFGMTKETLARILAAGADAVTGGNHIWEKRDYWQVMDDEKRALRPANFPAGCSGRGSMRFEKTLPAGAGENESRVSFLVVNLQGREFMTAIDCPFRCFDEIEKKPDDIILVDFHAESTREKESLSYYLDGRAAVAAGTHTHVQTADEKILPNGTAYITDLGMTGALDGVIGMDPKICIGRVRTQVLYRMEPAVESGPRSAAVQGILVEIDSESRKAVSIKRISRGQ